MGSVSNSAPELSSPGQLEVLREFLLAKEELREVDELPGLNLLWSELGVLRRKLVNEGRVTLEQLRQRVPHHLSAIAERQVCQVPKISRIDVQSIAALFCCFEIEAYAGGHDVWAWEEGCGRQVEQDLCIGVQLEYDTRDSVLFGVWLSTDSVSNLLLHDDVGSPDAAGMVRQREQNLGGNMERQVSDYRQRPSPNLGQLGVVHKQHVRADDRNSRDVLRENAHGPLVQLNAEHLGIADCQPGGDGSCARPKLQDPHAIGRLVLDGVNHLEDVVRIRQKVLRQTLLGLEEARRKRWRLGLLEPGQGLNGSLANSIIIAVAALGDSNLDVFLRSGTAQSNFAHLTTPDSGHGLPL
mmetsp:Transcript_48110/g.86555  ORF Transcript_48110/g.86555 Transcript_48110/m.86555 type:complete len:354 (+) Transcript_48110:41-1102(+)